MKKNETTQESDTPAGNKMGFLVEGMTELMKQQLGLTRAEELLRKHGLIAPKLSSIPTALHFDEPQGEQEE